jgi:endonuclease-8
MPEGDTILGAARRMRAALVDKSIESIETPQRRHALDRWSQRLAGRRVSAVDTRGKHLLLRFEGGLTLHSHLRMRGWWGVYRRPRRWGRPPHRAWLVIRTAEHDVVQFDGPVLELLTDARTRSDPRIRELGPDVLADDLDRRGFLLRLREDDPTRGIGDALLDQRNLCGVGNLWKSEGCFLAGVDPWRPLAAISDEQALRVVEALRGPMLESARNGGRPRPGLVYDRAGRPCPRCGEPIRAHGQGDDNRTTYWCPRCQSS